MYQKAAIESLKPYPNNTKHHPASQIDRLAKAIQFYGWRHPIIVSNQSGYIVVGHARLEAAKKLGLKDVLVHYQDFESEDQENGFRVADNAFAELGDLDFSLINEELAKLGPDFEIELLGLGEDFKLDPSEREVTFQEKELDENLKTDHECPSCGYVW